MRMLKVWLHIIVSVWLINSVTFPQINNIAEHGHHCQASTSSGLNNWADFLLHPAARINAGCAGKKHHTPVHRRFVHAKTHREAGLLSLKTYLVPLTSLKKVVKNSISSYIIGLAILPSYYSFLFRLKPF